MAAFDIQIEGIKTIERRLRELGGPKVTKITKAALRTGANVFKGALKINANSMIGGEMGNLIAKNTVVRAFKKRRRGRVALTVRLKSGEMGFIWLTQTGEREYIPAAIEYGHEGGWNQQNPTFVAAIPYARSAFDSAKGRVELAIRENLWRNIRKVSGRG